MTSSCSSATATAAATEAAAASVSSALSIFCRNELLPPPDAAARGLTHLTIIPDNPMRRRQAPPSRPRGRRKNRRAQLCRWNSEDNLLSNSNHERNEPRINSSSSSVNNNMPPRAPRRRPQLSRWNSEDNLFSNRNAPHNPRSGRTRQRNRGPPQQPQQRRPSLSNEQLQLQDEDSNGQGNSGGSNNRALPPRVPQRVLSPGRLENRSVVTVEESTPHLPDVFERNSDEEELTTALARRLRIDQRGRSASPPPLPPPQDDGPFLCHEPRDVTARTAARTKMVLTTPPLSPVATLKGGASPSSRAASKRSLTPSPRSE